MAGIVALVNQYQATKGFQSQPGLGNINPQLYRLAQTTPSAFHDIVSGNNIVPCSQGSPDCLAGSFGYSTAPGYDPATGLGSVDANNLVTLWNTRTQAAAVNLFVNAARVTMNDTIGMTGTVTPATGAGTPTGTVDFSAGGVPLGSVPLTLRNGMQEADLFSPAYLLGANGALTGTFTITAQYSGDAAFSSAGTTKTVQIAAAKGAATIVPIAPNTVWASPPDAQGVSWETTLELAETSGVAALITGFSIDGQAQTLSQYFPSPDIPPSGTVSATAVFRNLAAPLVRTFGFTGIDALGHSWSRQISVDYFPVSPQYGVNVNATPLVVAQNTSADPSCQWAVQLNIDETGGYPNEIESMSAGGVGLTFQQFLSSFGTVRMNAWAGLMGTICFSGITPPATDVITVSTYDGTHNVAVSFAGPPANPVSVSTAPANISLILPPDPPQSPGSVTAKLDIVLSDKTQPWTASIFPTNRTASWLTLSQYSGVGPTTITVSASHRDLEPGAYRAEIVIQSPNAVPQSVTVPVMAVLRGIASTAKIAGVANAASFQPTASPGMILSVFGTNLANITQTMATNPLPYSASGVSATVNGIAAPLIYISQAQINLQVPYEAGAGPAVLGIDNNGQIAGFQFQITPSAPGIFADSNGNLAPNATVPQGSALALYMTGVGEVQNWLIATGEAPPTGYPLAYLPLPGLPLSITVGGVPAFIQYAAISPGLIGTLQVNFSVPASVPAGTQSVVVTVGGVSSPPVKITVLPAP